MRRFWRGIAVAAVWVGASSMAVAADDCPRWFPDFAEGCEREARPAGAVMPMSFPYIFEEPYITTGLNFVGIWHDFPENLSLAGGGSLPLGGQLGVLALQIRLALTERLAFIATKDGVGFLDPGAASPVDDGTGLFNLTFGFKYALFEWAGEVAGHDHSAILTPSLRYEIPLGQRAVFQGHDDGLLIPAIAAGYQIERFSGILAVGGQAPIDANENGSNLFYNLHVSYAHPLGDRFVTHVAPFMEFNGIHWTHSGRGTRAVDLRGGGSIPIGLVPGFEGVDVANLGNLMVSGNDYITMAFGLRLPMRKGLSFGASYEFPVSIVDDLTDQRVTMMLTWEL